MSEKAIDTDKFNTVMGESDARALCVMVHKPVSVDGYNHNFLPHLEKMVKDNGEIRLLIYFKEYKGWEEEAAARDMAATAKYGKKLRKMALVNPPPSMIMNHKLKEQAYAGEVKVFAEKELDTAIGWVKA